MRGTGSCFLSEHVVHHPLAHHEGTSQDEETETQTTLVTSTGVLSCDPGLLLSHQDHCSSSLPASIYSAGLPESQPEQFHNAGTQRLEPS